MTTLVERLRAVEHHDWCCRFASTPEGCAPDGCDCGHDVADEAAARLEEVEARAEQMPALFERTSALEEALRLARRHLSQDHACGSQRRGSHAKVWAYEIEAPDTAAAKPAETKE